MSLRPYFFNFSTAFYCVPLHTRNRLGKEPGVHKDFHMWRLKNSCAKYQQIQQVQNITRIYALSKRNVILRYKNSLVGFFWGFIKPLIYLMIFIVIFSKAFPSGLENYVLFATSGLVLWFFFSNVTSQSVGNIVGSSGLIKSLSIPPFFFPLSEVISELFNLLLTLAVFVVVMYWFNLQYSLSLLLIIPCVVLFSIFALGVSLFLCSLNVFFRDVGIIWTTVQPALFYMTPIGYSENAIPDDYKLIIKLNPVYYFIKLGRTIFHDPSSLAWDLWGKCLILAVVAYAVGHFVFNKLKNQFISAI